jgi:hypothetical protein
MLKKLTLQINLISHSRKLVSAFSTSRGGSTRLAHKLTYTSMTFGVENNSCKKYNKG